MRSPHWLAIWGTELGRTGRERNWATIAFYKGEVYRAARFVVTAYSVAEMNRDVAYVIRLRAALGEGFAEFGHPKDALVFFEKALALAAETPDVGLPVHGVFGEGARVDRARPDRRG